MSPRARSFDERTRSAGRFSGRNGRSGRVAGGSEPEGTVVPTWWLAMAGREATIAGSPAATTCLAGPTGGFGQGPHRKERSFRSGGRRWRTGRNVRSSLVAGGGGPEGTFVPVWWPAVADWKGTFGPAGSQQSRAPCLAGRTHGFCQGPPRKERSFRRAGRSQGAHMEARSDDCHARRGQGASRSTLRPSKRPSRSRRQRSSSVT
jgi:hypothetical protein